MSPAELKTLGDSVLAQAKAAGGTNSVLARMDAARALIRAGLTLLAQGGIERAAMLALVGNCLADYRCPCRTCLDNERAQRKAGN